MSCNTQVSQAVLLPGLLPGMCKTPFSIGFSEYIEKDLKATKVFSPWENFD